MKLILFIIIIIFNFNRLSAQPISTPSIKIKNILVKKTELIVAAKKWRKHQLFEIEKGKEYKENYIPISVNDYYSFIYKKDTMQIKLLFDEYSYYQISINKLLFKKGSYIIDLKKCVEEKGFVIENFPCDCMAYRKEEKE